MRRVQAATEGVLAALFRGNGRTRCRWCDRDKILEMNAENAHVGEFLLKALLPDPATPPRPTGTQAPAPSRIFVTA